MEYSGVQGHTIEQRKGGGRCEDKVEFQVP